MPNPYANTHNDATIHTATLWSARKRTGRRAGRVSRLLVHPAARGLLGAFSALCLVGLGLTAMPDGRGLIVGIALVLLMAGCARV